MLRFESVSFYGHEMQTQRRHQPHGHCNLPEPGDRHLEAIPPLVLFGPCIYKKDTLAWIYANSMSPVCSHSYEMGGSIGLSSGPSNISPLRQSAAHLPDKVAAKLGFEFLVA